MRQKARILEEYLVLQAQAGVPLALSRLVELRGPKLLSHATRLLGHPEDARDVVQDAWVEIMRGLKGLREPRAFAAWSTRIVTRRCARDISGNIKRRNLGESVWSAGQIPVEQAAEPEDHTAAVRHAIAALSPAHSATIALFYLEEMSLAEVSVALDIPLGTVKTRLMHARDKLKHALKGVTDE